MKATVSEKKIIIEGVTESGETFRPSDWAERMSGSLCTFQNRRITYSPLLQPMVKDGNKCILLDPELKSTNPSLYESIMEFAQNNHLRISGMEEKNNHDKSK
jgi:hypothetical protein